MVEPSRAITAYTPFGDDEVAGHELCTKVSADSFPVPLYFGRQIYPCTAAGAEDFTEDYSFIFFSAGPDGRIRYANRAWYEFAGRNASQADRGNLPAGCRLVLDGLAQYGGPRRAIVDAVRNGDVPFWEEIVPCHTSNQLRWMLYRIQHFGEEVVFSCFFLRAYNLDPPARPKIRCLLTGADRSRGWIPVNDPIDRETTLALGPTCSLHLYSLLAEESVV